MQKKYVRKIIPTLIAIIVIIILCAILIGGFVIYRYFEVREEEKTERLREEEKTKRLRELDWAIKASLASMRAMAEIYFEDTYIFGLGYTYLGFCDDDGFGGGANVARYIKANGSKMQCADRVDSWIACAQLKEIPTSSWCVDSKGSSIELVNTTCDSAFVTSNTECK